MLFCLISFFVVFFHMKYLIFFVFGTFKKSLEYAKEGEGDKEIEKG